MTRKLLLLLAICMAACVFAEEKKPIVIGQAIDFLDNAFFTGKADYYSKEELRERVQASYDAGVRRVYFRGTGGVTYYPSSVRRMYTGSHNNEWAMKLYKTIHSYDVVAEYIKVCHELGMELYYWDPIFDCSLYMENYPGTEDHANFGALPTADLNIKEEHWVKHRQADLRPRENLHGAIGEIRLHLARAPEPALTADDLVIYTAPHMGEGNFRRYEKPFTVRMEGNDVIIGGLYITDPVLKFTGDFRAISETKSPEAAKATYTNGEPVTLFTCCELTLGGDKDFEKVLHGCAGFGNWWGGKEGSFIVRFGDFERYARGVPEYAFRENRERMERIVAELYERYPDLDGVAFSIRSHSLSRGGDWAELGGGNLFYGFSDPVVEEFQRRYGIDPRKEAYDEQAFLKLRGEYFTQMLDGVSKIIHAKGGRLSVMAAVNCRKVGPYDHGSMYPWLNRCSIDNYFDIGTWAKRGIVDNVIMLGTGHQQNEWTQGWKDEVKAFKAKLEGTDTKLTLHYLINSAKPENVQNVLPQVLDELDIDEVEFYEEVHMFHYGAYPILKEALEKAGRPHWRSRWAK